MIKPKTEAELAQAVADATGPLKIIGGGTRDVGAPVTGGVLSTRGLSGIELYEPGALTIVVKAGTPVAKVEEALAAEGQRLPFEPMDYRALLGTTGTPTIGGVVASNASGPRRIQAGACRDSLIGVRFVDGRGDAIKNGGRVMKNVTGYDLVKLMAGSWGTLGVLSEVSFKVLPVPEAAAELRISGLSEAEATKAMSAAMGSPFDVTGAAHLPEGVGEGPDTILRIEGFSASVAYRAKELTNLLAPFGDVAVEHEPTQVAASWKWLRDVEAFATRDGAVWRVSLKPTNAAIFSAMLEQNDLEHQAIFDWAGGLVWLLVPDEGDAGAAVIRQQMTTLGGHATLFRAREETRRAIPVFQPEPAPIAAITAGLRKQFDPRGILNPGLMG